MSARLAILGGVEGKPCKLRALFKSWLWAQSALHCCGGKRVVCTLPTGLKVPEWYVHSCHHSWVCLRQMQEVMLLDPRRHGCLPAWGRRGTLEPWLGLRGALLRMWDSWKQDWGSKINSLFFSLMRLCFISAVGEGEELISPCLPPGFKSEWQHAEIVYKIKGQKAGIVIYRSLFLSRPASY